MRGKTLLWIGGALSALSVLPAVAADHDVSITIYANDLALVQDHRTINVTGGRQRIEFQNVSAKIRPETVSLAAGDLTIVEQNFDFDLLTPAKLMEKAEVDPPLLRGVLRLSSAVVDNVSRVEIHNAKRSAIRFELRLRLADGAQLIGAKPVSTSRDGRPLFELTIAAGGSAVVRYRTEHTSL